MAVVMYLRPVPADSRTTDVRLFDPTVATASGNPWYYYHQQRLALGA